MHIYVRRGLEVALVVGGGILFFAGQASADEGTTGADSALGGNQAAVSVVAPVSATGSSISVLGDSSSSGSTATAPAGGAAGSGGAGDSTSGADSAAGGNQVTAPVTAPVTAGGNSVSVLGDSSTSGADAGTDPATPGEGPSEPTTPTDPTAPGNPTTPGGGSDDQTDQPSGAIGTDAGTGSGGDNAAASAVPAFGAPSAATALAMTGGVPWLLLLIAGLLLLAGAGTRVTARRFADLR